MARLPNPGGDSGNWGEILNEFLRQSHKADGSLDDNAVNGSALANNAVSTTSVQNDAISEAKLSPAVRTKLNTSGSGSVADGSVTTAKLADDAVTNAKVAPNAGIAQAKIANLTSDLAAKADANHTHDLDDLADVNTSGATSGQVLTWQGSQWAAADQTGGTGGGTSDHGALTGLGDDDHPQYLNNTRGDARYYTRAQVDSAVSGKADTSHTHAASAITSGTMATARLGSGTADNTTYLRGDGTWATPPTGGGGSATNLTSTPSATNVVIGSSTGTDATVAGASTSNAGVMTSADKTKLNGIATGATANATDAQLRDRSTHTGSQPISSVSNLQSSLDGKADSSATVNLTGTQTVAGVKTFSSSPVVPTPTTNTQAANKAYVDSVAGGGGGGSGWSFRTVTGNTTAANNEYVLADASGSGITVTLPTPSNGAVVRVKRISGNSNSVQVVAPAGSVIDGSGVGSDVLGNQWDAMEYVSNGTNWYRG